MSQQKYLRANQALGLALINLVTDDIRAILVDADDYTVDFAAHEFLSDVPGGARVGVSGAMAGKAVSVAGVFDADDTVVPAVTGDQFEAVILYQHTGVEGTSRLISYDDSATALPVTPNGTDITLVWDNGANKIFTI